MVQHKHSKNQFDTPESIQARRAFLSGGFYVCHYSMQWLKKFVNYTLQICSILVVSEGYYTSAMQKETLQCVGVDIAQKCELGAAKMNRDVTWVVGTGAKHLLIYLIKADSMYEFI